MSSTNQQTDKSTSLVLIGGGGHAKVVAESAIAEGWTILGYADDQESAPLSEFGFQRIGTIESIVTGSFHDELSSAIGDTPASLFIAVGDNDIRARIVDLLYGGSKPTTFQLVDVIHPSAIVSPSAILHGGVLVGPRAVINASTIIQTGTIVNTAAVIEHDNRIGRCAHIAPGTILGGRVEVGDESLIGLGVRVRPGTHIGHKVVIGAGAVVVSDIPDNAIATGVPAEYE